ncbi:thiol:disulfide interchange protein DsbA [Kerstersia gyiorum]|uniref:Thiol:disulfide interchange protein n=1 Tax=Kerstersia gyiorum TaxID=206506 RepID=A0A4Q7MVD7_9BURK|nr:thiol:disulfide interchange protein DsbA/DsbL [Kerstersia gyiorum]KAB0544002.1 thiol:disulfide interchange protein DsbA/DsbL [Kerstersia gyiorum]RZS72972.1 thiol:disulfide interchange protein DsbA [Kerstersia gyiorum]
MTFSFSRLLAAATLMLGAAVAPLSQAQTSRSVELQSPQRTDSPGQVEVLEFFAYTCIHCKLLDPMINAWAKEQPQDVNFMHVPLGGDSRSRPLQQMYYTLNALNRMDLHEKYFTALHDERKRLFTRKDMADWAVEQGVDRAAFNAAFDSMGVSSQVARADELAKNYNVNSTPTIIVNGRYVTSPAHAGGYRESVEETGRLVQQERAKLSK